MNQAIIEKIVRAYRRYGLVNSSKKAFVFFYNRILRNRTVVYSFDENKVNCAEFTKASFVKYVRKEDLDKKYVEQLKNEVGAVHLEELFSLFKKKSVLYLVLYKDEIIGYWWVAKGKNIENWFVPLEDNDLVFYSALIFSNWRNQSISSSILTSIVHQELKGDETAYLDIKEWNIKAQRAFAKAGFVPVS